MAGRPHTRTASGPASRASGATPVPPVPLPDPARLSACVEPVLRSAGVVLEGLTVSRVGRQALVVVVIDADDSADTEDTADSALDLDRVAEVSRMVSDALDSAPASLLPGGFTLEVTTPGIDRPLVHPRQWSRNIGRLVQVQRRDAPAVTGRVLAVTAQAVDLEVPLRKGAPATTQRIAYGDVVTALVQVEFSRVVIQTDGCDE